MTTLTTAHDWSGAPAPEARPATLRLDLTDTELVVEVDAPYFGDPPPPGSPGPTDELWSFEVVELFVLNPETERYLEVELSPHGHHWVIRLEGVRNKVEQGIDIAWSPTIEGDRFRGTARIPRRHLPEGATRCNAYHIAGVAGSGEGRRYRAWAPVPGERPDFHRLQHFGEWPFASPG